MTDFAISELRERELQKTHIKNYITTYCVCTVIIYKTYTLTETHATHLNAQTANFKNK
jgi:hypothetical protein